MDKSSADTNAVDGTTKAANLYVSTDSSGKVDSFKSNLKDVMTALTTVASDPYILIGGSSLVLYGSTRTTNDIDLLVNRASVPNFTSLKEAVLKKKASKYIKEIDLLTEVVGRFDFDSLAPFTVDVGNVKIPTLDVLLGTKVLCHYHRQDGEEGDKKRASDLSDINWICQELGKQGQKVQQEVSEKMVCGPYNMFLVVMGLYETYGTASLEVFEEVGGRDFECKWEDETFKEQVELYDIEIEESGFGEGELNLLESKRRKVLAGK